VSELYLIAHSVRGEAAFDVALQMDCPCCVTSDYYSREGCLECDSLGYWWIIPTSGHRAYPYWTSELGELTNGEIHAIGEVPSGWPDHYRTKAAPKLDITSLFKPAPKAHIARRL